MKIPLVLFRVLLCFSGSSVIAYHVAEKSIVFQASEQLVVQHALKSVPNSDTETSFIACMVINLYSSDPASVSPAFSGSNNSVPNSSRPDSTVVPSDGDVDSDLDSDNAPSMLSSGRSFSNSFVALSETAVLLDARPGISAAPSQCDLAFEVDPSYKPHSSTSPSPKQPSTKKGQAADHVIEDTSVQAPLMTPLRDHTTTPPSPAGKKQNDGPLVDHTVTKSPSPNRPNSPRK